MRVEILGIGFDSLEPVTALEKALALADTGRCAYIVTPNPEIVYLSRKDTALRSALNGADLVLADGIGVLYAAKILGAPLRCRVTGIGMASALLPHLARKEKRLFLIGAAPGVAEEAAERLKNQYPGLNVCGVMDGYYKDDADAVRAINEAEPDAVFVCLGSPKQELFMAEYAGQIKAGLMIGLGGVLDVFSGRVRRAPALMSRLGLEWLYRIAGQPSRWKRAFRLPAFMFLAVGARIKGKRQ